MSEQQAVRIARDTVVLLCQNRDSSSNSGTGVIIDYFKDEEKYWVLTCDHVVRSFARDYWGAIPAETNPVSILVNGTESSVVYSGETTENGIDLAIVEVPGKLPATRSKLEELGLYPKVGTNIFGFGYTHLSNRDYILELFRGKVGLPARIHRRGAPESVQSWRINPLVGSRIQPGNSGTALFNGAGKLVGLVSYRRDDHGLAIDGNEIGGFIEAAQKKLRPTARRPDESQSEESERPPILTGLPVDPADKNKGQFGNSPEAGGRELLVIVYSESKKDYCYIDIIVKSVDGSEIQPPVYFHLHESYPQPTIRMKRRVEKNTQVVLEDVYTEGAYTIGAQVKDSTGKWIKLEYDLAEDPSFPRKLRDR